MFKRLRLTTRLLQTRQFTHVTSIPLLKRLQNAKSDSIQKNGEQTDSDDESYLETEAITEKVAITFLPCQDNYLTVAIRMHGDYYLFDADSHIEKKLKTAQITDPPTGVFYTHIPNETSGIHHLLAKAKANDKKLLVGGTETISNIIGSTMKRSNVKKHDYLQTLETRKMLVQERYNHTPFVTIHTRGLFDEPRDEETNLSYVLEATSKPAKLNIPKLKAFGIPPGPQYTMLSKGEDLILPSGKIIPNNEIVLNYFSGGKVTILSCENPRKSLRRIARGSDVVIYKVFNKTTAETAGVFARGASATVLVIVCDHKYDGVAALQEARQAFRSDNVILAKDYMTIQLPDKTTKEYAQEISREVPSTLSISDSEDEKSS